MKIWLADEKKYLKVTFAEIKRILTSGLSVTEWTKNNIKEVCSNDRQRISG